MRKHVPGEVGSNIESTTRYGWMLKKLNWRREVGSGMARYGMFFLHFDQQLCSRAAPFFIKDTVR